MMVEETVTKLFIQRHRCYAVSEKNRPGRFARCLRAQRLAARILDTYTHLGMPLETPSYPSHSTPYLKRMMNADAALES